MIQHFRTGSFTTTLNVGNLTLATQQRPSLQHPHGDIGKVVRLLGSGVTRIGSRLHRNSSSNRNTNSNSLGSSWLLCVTPRTVSVVPFATYCPINNPSKPFEQVQ